MKGQCGAAGPRIADRNATRQPGIGLQEKKPGWVLLLFQPCECLIVLAQGRADDGQFVRRNVSLLGLSNELAEGLFRRGGRVEGLLQKRLVVTERTPVNDSKSLFCYPPLEKRGYCFFPDAEAATDAVAVSFLYSAIRNCEPALPSAAIT